MNLKLNKLIINNPDNTKLNAESPKSSRINSSHKNSLSVHHENPNTSIQSIPSHLNLNND